MITATATLRSSISVTATLKSIQTGSCADVTNQVNGTTIGTTPSGDTHNQQIQNSGGTNVGTSANPSIVGDSQIQINSVNSETLAAERTLNQSILNSAGSTVGTSANPSVVSDSTVTLNGESLGATGSIVAEGSVDIPVTLDGSPSGTWNGSEFALTSSATSREWVRNPLWLDMPTTTDGDNVIYILFAVRENVPNFLSLRALTSAGNYTVDLYNDGTTISSHSSGSQADFDLDYAKGVDEVALEGYKQCMVKITGDLTAFDLYRRHPDIQAGHPICSGVLSVKVTSQTITSLENVVRGNSSVVYHRMLEEFEHFGTSNVSVIRNGFIDTHRLGIIKGDFSSIVNAQNAFQFSGDFDHRSMVMPTSGINNFASVFSGSLKRIFSGPVCANFFRGVEYPVSTFNNSGIQIFGTKADPIKLDSLNNSNGLYQMFQANDNLTQVHFYEATTAPEGLFRTFRQDYSLTIITGIDGSAVTNMTGTFDQCYSLSWLQISGITVSFSLEDCNFSRAGLVQVFIYLGTANATVTATNNPGVSDLTAADLLIATDKGWTVIT